MEVQAGVALFGLMNQALDLFKKARDAMPDTEERRELTRKLAEVESAFKIAEAKAAQELGYELCRCAWPPTIMLAGGDGVARCSKCKSGSRDLQREAPPAAENQNLSEEETKILSMLSALEKTERMGADDLGIRLGIASQRAEYWLEKLHGRGLIYQSLNMMTGTSYSLDQPGREILVKLGLL